MVNIMSVGSVMKRTLVVYGSTGLIGREVVKQARECGYSTIGIARTSNKFCDVNYSVDFLDFDRLQLVTNEVLTKGNEPVSIVFCHRSRDLSSVGHSQIERFRYELDITLNPYIATETTISTLACDAQINIVTVTSNAGAAYAQDTRYSYQIVKAAQISAACGLAYSSSVSLGVYSNIVRFGEAIDENRQTHDEYHSRLFEELRRQNGGRPVATVKNIGRVVMLLCDADKLAVNGQEIIVDGGISKVTQESIVRSSIARQAEFLW